MNLLVGLGLVAANVEQYALGFAGLVGLMGFTFGMMALMLNDLNGKEA